MEIIITMRRCKNQQKLKIKNNKRNLVLKKRRKNEKPNK